MGINLYDVPHQVLPAELVTVLAENQQVRIERIVSTGQTSCWYDQVQAEFVALLTGTATIEFLGGKQCPMLPGDTLLIEPHQVHRVAATSVDPPCVWLCVFFDSEATDRRLC